ncbi:TldD/PmbA family protein [Thermococcus sp.]|uniref:TldD/PmbA family protein n=1 Tax=Thermococcus sp. TaxID=35749 RepID=UPI002622C535|nr:TldD/PmbA family protein [Thermococcus sp.]
MIDELTSLLSRKDIEWELYWGKGRSGSFGIERENLERSQRKFYSGIGLRIGYKGKLGFSYITGLSHDRQTLERFVERTIKLARVSEVPFRGFPVPSKVLKVGGLYDRRIDEIPFEEAHAMALEVASLMRSVKAGGETLSGSLSFAVSSEGVVNSNGVELETRTTGMGVYIYAVRGTGTGSFQQTYRSLQPMEELEKGIAEARTNAELGRKAKRLDPFRRELVLEPEAFESILWLFLENVFGDTVYYRRSRFSERGLEVGSEGLGLEDDSTIDGLPGSYPFDGEGSPGQRTTIVEDGILRSFLLDYTFASFLGMESTGNALRSFRSVPRIGTSNIVVGTGDLNLEDFEGVVVKDTLGAHTANPVSGDFSLTVSLGYVVRKGELRPFRDNMLSGNIFELLKTLKPGKKAERRGSFISPRVLVEASLV